MNETILDSKLNHKEKKENNILTNAFSSIIHNSYKITNIVYSYNPNDFFYLKTPVQPPTQEYKNCILYSFSLT